MTTDPKSGPLPRAEGREPLTIGEACADCDEENCDQQCLVCKLLFCLDHACKHDCTKGAADGPDSAGEALPIVQMFRRAREELRARGVIVDAATWTIRYEPPAPTAPEDGGAREIAHTLVTIVCEFPPPTHSEQCDRITAAISRERAATKVAHDGLVAAADELSKARAALAASEREVRRLTGACESYRIDRDRLAAEVERLRAALERIKLGDVTVPMEWSAESSQREADAYRAIARKALAHPPPEPSRDGGGDCEWCGWADKHAPGQCPLKPTPAASPGDETCETVCPSHCSYPDTSSIDLCPCDPGDCARCDELRKKGTGKRPGNETCGELELCPPGADCWHEPRCEAVRALTRGTGKRPATETP